MLAKPYAQQVVWGPHFYGQSVIPYDLPKQFMQVMAAPARAHTRAGCICPAGRAPWSLPSPSTLSR